MNDELRTDERWLAAWGTDWVLEGCANCNGVFVLPPDKVSQRCPFCGQAALTQMDPADDRPIYTHPPELLVPFRAADNQLRGNIRSFAKSIWLAPADLNEGTLLSRMQPVYLPMWLVDAEVQGEWQNLVSIIARRAELMEYPDEAIALKDEKGIEVIWMQLGVRNDEAARRAEEAGIQVVMNRCPKIEYGRLSREIGWSGINSGQISSRKPVLRAGFQSLGIRQR